jgi:hypothetical protein
MTDFANFHSNVFEPKDGSLVFNVQPLHAILQVFRLLMNLAKRGNIHKFSKTGTNQREREDAQVKQREENIKTKIRERYGVVIDEPKSGGAGTSTTGGVVRKLFKDPEGLAEILNLDKDFVNRLTNILRILNQKHPVKEHEFEKYCEETYKMYCDLYNWYFMPPTLHKILKHSSAVMKTLPMTIGEMSEESAESTNRVLKHDKLHHARKISHKVNLLDVFNRRMARSDEVILQYSLENFRMRHRKKKDVEELPEVVKNMLCETIEEDSGEFSDSDVRSIDEEMELCDDEENYSSDSE